jgi:hypothetical protein
MAQPHFHTLLTMKIPLLIGFEIFPKNNRTFSTRRGARRYSLGPDCGLILITIIAFVTDRNGWAARQSGVEGFGYATGAGAPQSYTKSYQWMFLFAAHGNPVAQDNSMKIKTVMTPEQPIELERLAAACDHSFDQACH